MHYDPFPAPDKGIYRAVFWNQDGWTIPPLQLFCEALIVNNGALTSLSGLDNLTSVGGYFYIYDNFALCKSLVDTFVARFPYNDMFIFGSDDSC